MAVSTAGSAAVAGGEELDSGGSGLRVRLSGYQEDPLVFSTTGSGVFRIHLNDRTQEITYQLSYTGLEGTITQAHVHIGGARQSGGITFFICTNAGNGPAGTQVCPAAPATVTGTIRPADIIGPAGQGVAAGEFPEVVAAIRAGMAYVNVHSSLYPGGEIRAQLDRHDHHH